MRLHRHAALVTGAASGIGAAIATLFAAEGCSVTVVDQDAEAGRRTCDAIRAAGGECLFVEADVADETQMQAAVERSLSAWGALHHLVCNAGMVAVASIDDCSLAQWRRVLAVNLDSVFIAARAAHAPLAVSGCGTIVTLGSVSSLVAQGRTPAYVASKGAVLLLTKALALDFAVDGIRCNCLCPGITDTPMFRQHMDAAPDPAAALDARRRRVPLGRFLTPRDIARAALYLSSEDSAGITGTAHVVDAGYLAAAEWDTRQVPQRMAAPRHEDDPCR